MLYVIEDIGSRQFMEDRHSVNYRLYKDIDYFGVYDGHGDEKIAVFLKLYLKDILKSELMNSNVISVEQCMLNAFTRLQSVLPKQMAMHSGSTALVILKQQNTVYVANVGDCRAIMNNFDKAVSLTEDHKPGNKSEYDRIIALGGSVTKDPNGVPRVNGTLALSRAIGDLYLSPFVSWVPDIYRIELRDSNNYIIAASDGLWDVFENQEIVNLVHNRLQNTKRLYEPKKILNSVCTDLLKSARRRGSGDNITILVLLL